MRDDHNPPAPAFRKHNKRLPAASHCAPGHRGRILSAAGEAAGLLYREDVELVVRRRAAGLFRSGVKRLERLDVFGVHLHPKLLEALWLLLLIAVPAVEADWCANDGVEAQPVR